MKILAILGLLVSFAVQATDDCVTRELGRMRVTEVPSGEFYDTHIIGDTFGVDFYGSATACGTPIRTMEYSGNMISALDGEVVQYSLRDFVDVEGYLGNGAQYTVRSRYPDGAVYDIVFFRRAPVTADYDPSTLIRIAVEHGEPRTIKKEGGGEETVRTMTIYELDYRNPR